MRPDRWLASGVRPPVICSPDCAGWRIRGVGAPMFERPDRSPQRNALRSSRPIQSALHRTTSHASHHAPCGPLGPLPGPLDLGPGCPHIPQSLQLCPHWSYWYYLVRHLVIVIYRGCDACRAQPRRHGASGEAWHSRTKVEPIQWYHPAHPARESHLTARYCCAFRLDSSSL